MAAYVIVNIEVRDAARYDTYRGPAAETVTAFGGRYLVRGGAAEKLEGSWEPKRVVVLEFENAERARAWWNSEMYRDLKALRQATTVTNMILVEGL